MSAQKTYRRGEFIFKEGDKISNVIIVQAGAIQLTISRNKKNVEIMPCGINTVIAESSIIGNATYNISAVATQDTKILEVPIEAFKIQLDTAPQFLKMLIKNFAERLNKATQEIRTTKMSNDASPCPDENVPQVYAGIYYTILNKGEKQPDNKSYQVDWMTLRQYCQRILGQSIKRVEGAVDILVKLKLAKYIMGKPPEDPEGPDQKMAVMFLDIQPIESFFEFFQYYYYKPGKAEILKVDDNLIQMVQLMLKCVEGQTPDRFGVIYLDYNQFAEKMNEELNTKLTADHFVRLENKGVFSKRRTTGDKTFIDFDFKEYQLVSYSWKFIREINKWNERGYVDLDEKEEVKKKKLDGPTCPQCGAVHAPEQKFCGECGFNLHSKAA